MITIALITAAKVILYVGLIPFIAMFILFPINDKPTSGTQKLVFVLVMALLFDVLFTHFIKLSIQVAT